MSVSATNERGSGRVTRHWRLGGSGCGSPRTGHLCPVAPRKTRRTGPTYLLLALVVVGILASWQQAIAQWGVPPDGTAAAWPRVGGQEPEPAVLSPQLSPIGYAPPRESLDNGRPRLGPDQPSWEACFELTYMKPRFEDGAEEDWRGNVLDFRLSPGPRVWITRTWPGGAAVRTRYWQFDHTTPTMWVVQVPFDSYVVFAQLEAHTVDFELAQKLEFHEWSLLMAAGARYAMM